MTIQTQKRRWLCPLALMLALVLPAASQSLGPEFKNPENIWFNNTGNIQLLASQQRITWTGKPAVANVYSAEYNGKKYAPSYTPPTIRVNPGNTLSINLASKINYDLDNKDDQNCNHRYTNFHYHGFEVSPREPQDDVFIKIENNGKNNPYPYRVELPPNHPEGMFWYHPHPHGCSDWQVGQGMSGILIVGDILKREYPQFAGVKEQILLLKDGGPTVELMEKERHRVASFVGTSKAEEGNLVTVNGLKQPNITINSGEVQFFRIGNVGTNTFEKIAFDGPDSVPAVIIAVDGMATARMIPLPKDGWLIPPGSRVEMLVAGPRAPGIYNLVSKPEPNAIVPDPPLLATLQVKAGALKAGSPSLETAEQAAKEPAAYYPRLEDFNFNESANTNACVIHTKPPTGEKYQGCDFVFSGSNPTYMINGKTYDENRMDVTCKIGAEIKWTLCNDTDQHHAFHIHQIHFDVLDIGGHPVEAPIRDVVDLPQQPDTNSVSRTNIKMNFMYDYLAGKFVLHCHMLYHEDHGMMMNIELVK